MSNQINCIVFISRNEVERVTGMSRSWIYQAMTENRFPYPVTCSSGARRWVLSEVQMWLQQRIQERDAKAHATQRMTHRLLAQHSKL